MAVSNSRLFCDLTRGHAADVRGSGWHSGNHSDAQGTCLDSYIHDRVLISFYLFHW